MSLVTLKDVTIAFDGVNALQDVSLTVEKGDYLLIVGENGSGKSTLMRAILGLVRPQKGSVTYGDGLKRNRIGYLPQRTETQKDFPASVEEVVLSGCVGRMGHKLSFGKDHRALAEEKMKLLDVFQFRKKSFRTLSGGQQQRALLARTLCATDSLLLLDEPVTGLDPDAAKEMYRVIRALNRDQGVAVVMVSHDLHDSMRDAERVLVMDRGVDFLGSIDDYVHRLERRVSF